MVRLTGGHARERRIAFGRKRDDVRVLLEIDDDDGGRDGRAHTECSASKTAAFVFNFCIPRETLLAPEMTVKEVRERERQGKSGCASYFLLFSSSCLTEHYFSLSQIHLWPHSLTVPLFTNSFTSLSLSLDSSVAQLESRRQPRRQRYTLSSRISFALLTASPDTATHSVSAHPHSHAGAAAAFSGHQRGQSLVYSLFLNEGRRMKEKERNGGGDQERSSGSLFRTKRR